MKLAKHSLVLVADGRKLLFLRNHGDESKMDLHLEAHQEQHNPPTREQGTDAPGQIFLGGGRRSAMEQTDFHQIEEDRFAGEAAEILRDRALNGDFKTLVVVAPPRTLGELRKHYHKEVAGRIVRELDKDLTGFPVADIEAALINA